MRILESKAKDGVVTTSQIKKVIHRNCGTSRMTFYNNLKPLLFLKWLKRLDKHRYKIDQDYSEMD